jgi:GGDEF domain-containing protein
MAGDRIAEIIASATSHARPAAVVWIDLQNFKPLNVVLSFGPCDEFLVRLQRRLGEIGRTWRTGGDEFVTLVGGELPAVTEQIKAFSWLFHTTVDATEAWSFRFSDGRESQLVSWRTFQVVCTPRCGLVELGTDAAESLELAHRRCDAQRTGDPLTLYPGFAPIAKGPWTNQTMLATSSCPACGHASPIIIDEDLGWSQERCPRCDVAYERTNMLVVQGKEFEAGYA